MVPIPGDVNGARRTYAFTVAVAADVRAIAEALLEGWDFPPEGGHLAIDVLPGGANNVNLTIRRGDDAWAMKIRDPRAVSFNANLAASIAGQQEAARLGVAPAVLASTPEGHFLSDFLVGTTLRPANIRTNAYAPAMVAALRVLHGGRPGARAFDVFDDIRVFMAEADRVGGAYPAGYGDLWRVAQRFEAIFRASPPRIGFGHNDLVPQNFVATASGVKLVDFDYCGQALIALDMASATSQAEMTVDETEAFLRLYDPGLDDGQRARVKSLRFINALREAAWAVAAEPQLSDKTTLLEGWSYGSHRDVNMGLAEEVLRTSSLDALAASIGHVRPEALF